MKIPKLFPIKPKKKLQATARRVAAPAAESYDDEPQTKLSSAFIIVLILHVVAVGGIYAFNSIKAHRRAREPLVAEAAPPVTRAAQVPAAPEAQSPALEPTAPVSTGSSLTADEPASAPAPRGKVHQVKAGETLTRIAAQHEVSVADLQLANNLKSTSMLKPGQTLVLPAARKNEPARKPEETAPKLAAAPVKSAAKTYVVAKGDNPLAIARKLNVSYDDLLKVNKISDPKKLQVGQTLKVPAPKKVN
jgi:membrane-bound lytic murein transglycosylase D